MWGWTQATCLQSSEMRCCVPTACDSQELKADLVMISRISQDNKRALNNNTALALHSWFPGSWHEPADLIPVLIEVSTIILVLSVYADAHLMRFYKC